MNSQDDLDLLIQKISDSTGYGFTDRNLLRTSLTHRSYANEKNSDTQGDNERLEFLGDAVLDLVISETLMSKYPEETEGILSKYRSAIVNERTLAIAARSMDLGRFVRLGKGEEMTGGRTKNSILANTFEAVVAAIYLEGGYQAGARFIQSFLGEAIANVEFEWAQYDYKTALQEMIQRLRRAVPEYRVVSEMGPDHEKLFESEVVIDGRVYGTGRAKSKKLSEQKAADEALRVLQLEIDSTSTGGGVTL